MTAFTAGQITAGTIASTPHKTAPAPISAPAIGTNATLANGPITEPLPNVAANNGHSAAAIARLMPISTHTARAGRGQERGADFSSRRATDSKAAVPPTLIKAPGDSAAAGLATSSAAAEKVSVADGVVGRSSARATAAADNISHARTLGGSAPAISV